MRVHPHSRPRRTTVSSRLALAVLFALASGCARSPHPVSNPVPPADPGDITLSVYFIGDAGAPAPDGEPVLQALAADLRRCRWQTLVVFLGDNVYPEGMPPESSDERPDMERRLRDQIDAVRGTGATTIFLPGNHDWARSGADGLHSVLRQQAYFDALDDPNIRFAPRDGCPGPVVVDVAEHVRVVGLDTQWWFHGKDKPEGPTSPCPAGTEDAVIDSLRSALATAGDRIVIVVGHHGPLSTGPHGGHFTWRSHIFPFTDAVGWLWLPLPIVGSVYPLARNWGISDQDLSAGKYKHLLDRLDEVFVDYPPLVYAAGHEHVLEVLRGGTTRYVLVSGAGIFGHTEAVGWREETEWASRESGFMRLDFLGRGETRLGVTTVDANGRAIEAYSTYLE